MDETSAERRVGGAAQQLESFGEIAAVFAMHGGEKAIAEVHQILAKRGMRRLTVATLNDGGTSPVTYRYHADVAAGATEPLDAQTLALALGSEQLRELPVQQRVRMIGAAGQIAHGRLQHAWVSPIRVGGAPIGFCVAQSESTIGDADTALLHFASLLIGQTLELGRESAAVEQASRALNMLLETARALSSGLDLTDLFAKFHTLVGRVMDASLFVAALATPDGEQLEIEYSAEFGRRSVERVRVPLTTVSGDVLRSGLPVIIRRPEDWRSVRSITLGEATEPASALIIPMKLGERVLGVLSVQSPRAESYSDSDCDLLTAISEQAAVAVENLKNLKASTQRAADLNLLVEVASAVSSELDLHLVFGKIHGQVKRVIDAPLFFVALRSGESDAITLEYLVEGEHIFPPAEHHMEGTIVGRVMTSGKAVLVGNMRERDLLTTKRIGEGPTTVQSIVAVPMTVRGRTIGAISAQSYEPAAYDERHLKLLSAIAEQSAVAVQNAQLYEQARQLADNDALTGLAHQRSVQERLSYELKRARRAGAPLALLMMDIDKFKQFNDTYGHQVGDRVLREVADILRRVARATDVIGRYGGDEFCAILPDTDRQAAYIFKERLEQEIGRKPFAIDDQQVIPIRLSIGVAVYPEECEEGHELLGVADAALYAAKRGESRHAVSGDDLLSTLEGDLLRFGAFIAALANSGRVKLEQLVKANKLAARYALVAGLTDHERDVLVAAATLADIGELAIPGILFSKPGKLEKEDYEIIKRHPRLGHEMLSAMRDGDEIALAVLHHQERFDGTGYPDGLVGEHIPATSRILAAIGAYAAMTSDRPHRRALSELEARKELQAFAGSQFDPHVVALFMRCDLSL
ncbi:MAG: diguanylate cyclase [Candidatus Eremiobacteraeota bacterium]|nr:diguanylate cyclase [Candidatus Eremiobacteraeota bacterium]